MKLLKKICKKSICVALVLLMLAAMVSPAFAASVKAKVKSTTKFYTKASSSSKYVPIKKGVTVTVKNAKKGWAKVKYKGVTGYMKTSSLSKTSKKKSWKSKVVAMSWFDGGDDVLKEGSYGTIYDIKSGKSIRIKRMGGHNHADVEPASKKDTAKLAKIGYSWDSRPVILKAGGKYVACAINTKPHGDQTIDNNGFNGQFCLHMVGSKTHGSDSVNEEHQKSIQEAYSWAH